MYPWGPEVPLTENHRLDLSCLSVPILSYLSARILAVSS